jgi:hypothetical protein
MQRAMSQQPCLRRKYKNDQRGIEDSGSQHLCFKLLAKSGQKLYRNVPDVLARG